MCFYPWNLQSKCDDAALVCPQAEIGKVHFAFTIQGSGQGDLAFSKSVQVQVLFLRGKVQRHNYAPPASLAFEDKAVFLRLLGSRIKRTIITPDQGGSGFAECQ